LVVVLYACETWSLTLREKHRLRVLENRMLRRIFGRNREAEEDCLMRSCLNFTLQQILLEKSNQEI
jgi:hypothetical protein